MVALTKYRLPPPLWLGVFCTLGWGLSRWLELVPLVGPPTRYLCMMFVFVGVAMEAFSVYVFVRHKTTVNPLNLKKSSHLVVTGLYRVTRNPMYLGMLCILTAWLFYLEELSTFVLLPCFVLLMNTLQIKPEERALENIFGDDYLAYKARVRRWL